MSERLEGAPNFRGVAGQRTAGGARVRGGRLFRSGALHALTDADLGVLDALGIRLVCDLRGRRERSARPDRWPRGGAPARIELIGTREQRASSRRDLEMLLVDPTRARARSLMRDAYRRFPLLLAEPLRALFASVASWPPDGLGAVLVHCAAGKDRTGFAVAMILSAVGARRADIVEDYLRTGVQVPLERRIEDARASVRRAASAAPPDEVLAEFAAVDAALLELSFGVVEETFGTIGDYLAGPCGLRPEGREWLAQALAG